MTAKMTDRELLELAAKAAGINLMDWVDDETGFLIIDSDSAVIEWNPLNDYGDGLYLLASLRLDVEFDYSESSNFSDTEVHVISVCDHLWTKGAIETFNGDGRQAILRAIVRAAAEIGAGQ